MGGAMENRFFVYILASQKRGTLYVGVTSDISRRLSEHQAGKLPGFTARYAVYRLVHYEVFDDPLNAIEREKRLKKWNREWKIRLIEETNPKWEDFGERLNW